MTTHLAGLLATITAISIALPASAQMPLTPSRPLSSPSEAAASYVPPPPNPALGTQTTTMTVLSKSAIVNGTSGSSMAKSTEKTPGVAKVQRRRPVSSSDNMAEQLNRRELRMLQAGE